MNESVYLNSYDYTRIAYKAEHEGNWRKAKKYWQKAGNFTQVKVIDYLQSAIAMGDRYRLLMTGYGDMLENRQINWKQYFDKAEECQMQVKQEYFPITNLEL